MTSNACLLFGRIIRLRRGCRNFKQTELFRRLLFINVPISTNSRALGKQSLASWHATLQSCLLSRLDSKVVRESNQLHVSPLILPAVKQFSELASCQSVFSSYQLSSNVSWVSVLIPMKANCHRRNLTNLRRRATMPCPRGN